MPPTDAARSAEHIARHFAGSSVEALTERALSWNLARRVRRSALLQVVVAWGLVAVFWPTPRPGWLIAWAVLASVVALARSVDIARRERRADFLEQPEGIVLLVAVGACASGVLLAVAYLAFAAEAPVATQLAFAVVVVGVSASSAGVMAGHPLPYLAHTLPPLVVLPVGLVFSAVRADSTTALATGVLLAFYPLAAWALFRQLGEQLRESMRLQFLNGSLVRQLESRNVALTEERDELRVEALTDLLTGLPNRRHFDATLRRDWARCRRERASVACILLAFDDDETVRERLGHTVGELRLRALAARLMGDMRRSTDFVARMDDRTFGMLLPSTDADGARVFAKRLLAQLLPASADERARGAVPRESMRVSAGVGSAEPPEDDDWAALTRDARAALERAQAAGGGRVEVTVHSGFTTTASAVV